MALAATFAGMGFGNAGVHIPHANAYPIAGRVRDFHPAGYPDDEPMVPHGMAVSLTAPEAFRFTFDAAPERHLRAAALLDPRADAARDAADFLPSVLADLMRDIGIPNGIGAVGYGEGDVDDLVEGTLKQQRLLATAPARRDRGRPGGHPAPLARAVVTAGADLLDGAARRRASPTSTTRRWPGRCTPPTPRSTGCCPQVVVRPRARRRGASRPSRSARESACR